MGACIKPFQYGCLLLVFHVISKLSVLSIEESNCSYPQGSIACKVWNHTNMDCTWRELVCIPPLRHKASVKLLDLSHNKLETVNIFISAIGLNKLKTLDLSFNVISYLPDNSFMGLSNLQNLNLSNNTLYFISNSTFTGLNRLKTLDLSGNKFLGIATGSPFHDLNSLEILHLYQTYSFPMMPPTVNAATFTGLKNLRFLSIVAFDFSTATPFVHLSSLQHLELEIWTCHYSDEIFTGLDMLDHLCITSNCQPLVWDINICSLVSLQSLQTNTYELDISQCFSTFPVISVLNIQQDYFFSLPLLYHLESLSWKTLESFDAIQSLNALHSPLQNLTLVTNDVDLNSTTFESWPEWKQFLQVFEITFHDITLEGSPFKWFQKLRILRISSDQLPSSLITLSNHTFEGLESLLELHLNYLNFDNLVPSEALMIFGVYNALKVLNLAHNQLEDNEITFQICLITSLNKIDLSYNEFFGLQLRCSLPNLTILETEKLYSNIYFDDVCNTAPNLMQLNAKNFGTYLDNTTLCSKIVALTLSNSRVWFRSHIVVPHLNELYLSETTYNSAPVISIEILNNFKLSQIRIIDLSSNLISVIDKEDAWLLTNVTYLNLRNNTLTSLTSLHHLSKIQVLLVGKNRIGIVPEAFLGNKLHILELCNNVLQCDCNLESFRNWILTNKNGFLANDCSAFDPKGLHYKCSSPDGRLGISVTEIDLDCKSPLLKIISVSITCVTCLLVIVGIIIRYRWHIQYTLFLLFNRRAYQNYLVNEDNNNDNYDEDDEQGMPLHDAYVTYHIQDEDWVDGELLPNVEEGEEPFKLCLKTRDIRAGRPVFGEMSLRIQRCRKIIVILSPHFVNDNWCYFELNMAHHRVLEENSNVLIFIMLEDIPNNKLTLLLRQLFCRAQCLKWPADGYGQNLFWRRLREELKRPVPLDRRFNI